MVSWKANQSPQESGKVKILRLAAEYSMWTRNILLVLYHSSSYMMTNNGCPSQLLEDGPWIPYVKERDEWQSQLSC